MSPREPRRILDGRLLGLLGVCFGLWGCQLRLVHVQGTRPAKPEAPRKACPQPESTHQRFSQLLGPLSRPDWVLEMMQRPDQSDAIYRSQSYPSHTSYAAVAPLVALARMLHRQQLQQQILIFVGAMRLLELWLGGQGTLSSLLAVKGGRPLRFGLLLYGRSVALVGALTLHGQGALLSFGFLRAKLDLRSNGAFCELLQVVDRASGIVLRPNFSPPSPGPKPLPPGRSPMWSTR